jgi:hypothetical protein
MHASLPITVQGIGAMRQISVLLFAITLGLAGCSPLPIESPREALGRLNDLEDRAFAMAQLDGAGRFVVVAPLQELQAVAVEARSARLPGCFGHARDALVASIDQIILAQEADSGDAAMAEAWKRAAAYRNAAENCEKVLAS